MDFEQAESHFLGFALKVANLPPWVLSTHCSIYLNFTSAIMTIL